MVHAKKGDGYVGWPEHAPFDGIVVTAGIAKIPKAFVEQVRIGGKIIIPITDGNSGGHILSQYTKWEKGLYQKQVSGCCFVPFTQEKGGSIVNRHH